MKKDLWTQLKEVASKQFHFKKDSIIDFLVIILLLLCAIAVIYIFYSGALSKIEAKDLYMIFVTSLVLVSALAGYYQYVNTAFRKRKSDTLEKIAKHQKEIQKFRKKINSEVKKATLGKQSKEVSFFARSKIKTPLSVKKELHLWMCKYELDGEGKPTYSREENDHFVLTAEGEVIRQNIIHLLNEYEQLALGIYYNIYDHIIAKELMGGLTRNTFNLFVDYISHQRHKHGATDFAEYLEKLVFLWETDKHKLSVWEGRLAEAHG